jgi:hypothetical protein
VAAIVFSEIVRATGHFCRRCHTSVQILKRWRQRAHVALLR